MVELLNNPVVQKLPASHIVQTVNEQLAVHGSLVITAPPGAGKSTLLPLTILQSLTDGGKVLVLEPRRLAARQIAERMAFMLGEPVGETVGYRVRFENKVSRSTRIEVLTEGILTRMLVDDPTLEGVSVVVFDEFHERSIHSDLALALTREAQQIIRPDLRIVIMSATIDADAICSALEAPLVESDGAMHPVEVHNADFDLPLPSGASSSEVAAIVVQTIIRVHRETEGDILVFLPGEAEIRKCQELLGTHLGITHVCPLYGMLSPREQQSAISPSAPGERKIVLATSIAETSLTIEGVRVVIDSGLCRKMVFDARSGLSYLETVRISLDMARQRSGRAGRVAPGVCYRLWTRALEHRMDECRMPEILETDLTPMLLSVAAWGEGSAGQLAWLTPPPPAHVAQGMSLLQLLGAVDADNAITPHGRALSLLPCHPRIAQMLVSAKGTKQRELAADIAAILESSVAVMSLLFASSDIDINIYVDALRRARRNHDKRWERIIRASDYYFDVARRVPSTASGAMSAMADAGILLAEAYPERIAMALPGEYGRYRLASGDNAMVDASDDMSANQWIAIASMNAIGNGRVFLAAPVSPDDLRRKAVERDNISWDNKQGTVIARRELRIGKLLLTSRSISDGNREQIVETICEAAKKYGASMLDFSDDVLSLQRRIATASLWHPELSLPDLSADAVLQRSHDWLPMYIGVASTTSELKKINMAEVLWAMLTYEQQQQVNLITPAHIVLPTGRKARIEYRQGAEQPIIRLRLQDCFGMNDTPRVDNGTRPVLMELLSPGFKPVQLTQDLHSFWTSTYFEVRKELRRRYPKHSWPEDPGKGLDSKMSGAKG